MRIFAACVFAACLVPAVAPARELANINSAAWCARHAQTRRQATCLQAESRCRAALPNMISAGGCPDRQLEGCAARQGSDGSWCALLCCFDPDDASCTEARSAAPDIFTQPER
jgi:hypothetical protein